MAELTRPFTCERCGTVELRRMRGSPSRWCTACQGATRRRSSTPCARAGCDEPVRYDARYCSKRCAGLDRRQAPAPRQLRLAFPIDRRSPLRKAFEAQDWTAFANLARVDCTETETGCWLWQRTIDRHGYAVVPIGQRRSVLVHRAVKGFPSGVVHHVCAVRHCIAPDHLQVITHQENAAEMLERTAYQRRIAELEAALRTAGIPCGGGGMPPSAS